MAGLAVCTEMAMADEPYMEMSIPMEWALEAAKSASDACLALGFSTTVTVVDQRGQMRVQLMREGAFPHTVQTSTRKAVTAASRRRATSEIATVGEPTLAAVFNEIGLTTLSGGVPIVHRSQVIGGIGVAGSPGEDDSGRGYDEICIDAGLAAIADRLEE
jgi:uncharacterized protein GlcG (DUF336 family)